MANPGDPERHNVNLSRQVWGELKLRAFQEGMSASELVAYLVERFTTQGYHTIRLPRYQPRSQDEARLGRTVFFPPGVWQRAQKFAEGSGASISALIDYLIKVYLGLIPDAEAAQEPQAGKTVRIGEERVYLGEHPVEIDLKTGKAKEE